MSGGTRITLKIDVFEKAGQKALVMFDLTPYQLVTAILQEFDELEYLSNLPGRYRLLKAADGVPLDESAPLASQLRDGERLVLTEVDVPLPEDTAPLSWRIYFREMTTGTTHPVSWQPAIIGRTSENLPHNDRVAVDLKSLPTGLRVSRRHAQLTETDGRYYIENLSTNPLLLIPAAPVGEIQNDVISNRMATSIRVGQNRQQLHHGDILEFERSGITLKFVIRPDSRDGAIPISDPVESAPPDGR